MQTYEKDETIETPNIKNPTQKKHLTKLDILKKLSSGTPLREGLNDIVISKMGALVIIYNPEVSKIFQGGFRVDCKFTSKRLAELAKMDGAIILSEDFKKILYANTLLTPDPSLTTTETGTRHQSAQRTAKQTNGLAIAVSERKGEITIYYKDSKYTLQQPENLLRRATETLQILEKQREILNELLTNLNVLEITELVSIADVCKTLQRIEMIKKMSRIVNEYIVELGKDGTIVRMRMKEILQGIEKKEFLILKDYHPRPLRTINFFENFNFEEILNSKKIAELIFKKSLESELNPKGYRFLSKTSITKTETENLIKNTKNIQEIFNLEKETLKKYLKGPEEFKKEVNHIKEQIMVGKRI